MCIMNRLNPFKHFIREHEISTSDITAELFHASRTNNIRSQERA